MQTVETLIRRRILRCLIWICTVSQLPFYGYPDYNGLIVIQLPITVEPQWLEHLWDHGNSLETRVVLATEGK